MAPVEPEIALTTVDHTPEENARAIVGYLEGHGFLAF